jgi:hypothetical protein
MTPNRILNWEGCNNVRDLGGMNASNGFKTRWGAVVRGDHPHKLTADGWSALYAHGIRAIVSLRTHGLDDHPIVVSSYPDVTISAVEIEDVTDLAFREKWASSDLWGTPLYFSDALRRWPQRHVAALQAIAQAQPGGVLFHCGRGYDRTGIIAFLLLTLVGVSLEDITADYELSVDPIRDQLLAEHNTNTYEVLQKILEDINFEDYLIHGGLTQTDITAIRARLLTIEN